MTNHTPQSVEVEPIAAFDISDSTLATWAPLLVKLSWAAAIIGTIVGMILFWGVGDVFGQDTGTLVWVLTMGLCTLLMSIRQFMLAERD